MFCIALTFLIASNSKANSAPAFEKRSVEFQCKAVQCTIAVFQFLHMFSIKIDYTVFYPVVSAIVASCLQAQPTMRNPPFCFVGKTGCYKMAAPLLCYSYSWGNYPTQGHASRCRDIRDVFIAERTGSRKSNRTFRALATSTRHFLKGIGSDMLDALHFF